MNTTAARTSATSENPYLAPFATMTDGQLRDPKQLVGLARACNPNADPNRLADGLFVAESVNVIQRALDAGYVPFAVLTDRRWLKAATDLLEALRATNPELPVVVADSAEVCAITGYRETRGPLCAFHRKPEPALDALLGRAHRVAVLEDITNYTNIGAIFRSAVALGIDAVLLTPRCHDPLFRRASRVSMGTVFQVPWARIGEYGVNENEGASSAEEAPTSNDTWPEAGLRALSEAGFITAALALSDDSLSIADPLLKATEKLALVLGTEGDGLAPATIAACDYTVRIPMHHGVDSLNVAAASAVAFWETRWSTQS